MSVEKATSDPKFQPLEENFNWLLYPCMAAAVVGIVGISAVMWLS